MSELIIYVMGANKDPDNIRCLVPFLNDNNIIFFGPCMKALRKKFRIDHLHSMDFSVVTKNLYMASVNAANDDEVRKILWAGRISEFMTFQKAPERLKGQGYRRMLNHPQSPLHVEPILKNERLVGYRHISQFHQKNDRWIEDIVGKKNDRRVITKEKEFCLKKGYHPNEVFTKDCCFTFENIFFAQGQGIPITKKMVSILKKELPDENVNNYAIFGYTKEGELKSLRPHGLTITGDLAEQFIEEIKKRLPQSKKLKKSRPNGKKRKRPPSKKCAC